MNYQSVKIFLAIVEHRSISAAARALYLTQPAVSGHLNRLEEELGCPLILRQKGVQQITLTATGKAFVPVATQWIDAEKAVLRFKESCSQKTLQLATSVTAHDYLTAPIIQKLLLRNPDLKLNLQFIDPIRLFRHPVDVIMNRDVDALFANPTPPRRPRARKRRKTFATRSRNCRKAFAKFWNLSIFKE